MTIVQCTDQVYDKFLEVVADWESKGIRPLCFPCIIAKATRELEAKGVGEYAPLGDECECDATLAWFAAKVVNGIVTVTAQEFREFRASLKNTAMMN